MLHAMVEVLARLNRASFFQIARPLLFGSLVLAAAFFLFFIPAPFRLLGETTKKPAFWRLAWCEDYIRILPFDGPRLRFALGWPDSVTPDRDERDGRLDEH